MDQPLQITSSDDPNLDTLCRELAELSDETDLHQHWPAKQLQLCADYGVYRWFLSPQWGGADWLFREVVKGYLRLAESCLSTAFILTQRTGACRRLATSDNQQVRAELLPGLASGELLASVGISHLTTSRRHLEKPALTAKEDAHGYILDGY